MTVRIVRRSDASHVGTVEVEMDGRIRFLHGPEDLREIIETRLASGVLSVRSYITEHEDQIAVPHTMLPTERLFDQVFSSYLKHLGYCTEGIRNVLIDR